MTIPKLMKKTGLSREFFYKNPIVREEIDRAMERRVGMVDPRMQIIDRAMEVRTEQIQEQIYALQKKMRDWKRKIKNCRRHWLGKS